MKYDLKTMFSGFDSKVADELIRFIEKHHGRSPYRKVAALDADGTLWRGDVGEAFFRYQVEKGTMPHAPGKNPWDVYVNEASKGDTVKAFGWLAQWNAGVAEADLKQWADQFFRTKWLQNVFHPMRQLTHALLNAGFEVWIISGSIRWIVEACAQGFGIQSDRILGTEVEIKDGLLTDRIRGIVPYRQGKAQLVEKTIGCRPLLAAGNTFWDKELVDTAAEVGLTIQSEAQGDPNYDSEQRLARLAEANGWLIQRF